jgi:RNase E specificity factor CsrD
VEFMIKRNIIYIITSVGLSFLLVFLFVNWSTKDLYRENNRITIQQFAILVSQIERLIESDFQEQSNPEQLQLEQLNLIEQVVGWELADSKGKVLASFQRKPAVELRDLVSRVFYIPASESKQPMMLAVHFDLTTLAKDITPLTVETLILILILIVAITLITYFNLRWVIQLEVFSKDALISGKQTPHSDLVIHNIIGFTLSQLILNNRLLSKSKSELTNQIRRTTYIDETTELGNHLFFKAELQVRLHNQDEMESGLVLILAFVLEEGQSYSFEDGKQIAIANCLKKSIDSIDSAIVAKLKENEFVLLLPNITATKMDQFCKKLVKDLSNQVYTQPEELHHFVDIGISTYKQGFDYYHVLAEADLALRNAQLQGANNWYVYGEPLSQSKSKGRLKWQSFLRNVLDRRKISLYCQEIHYFDASATRHHEVLARIQDGDELLHAESFLAMAYQCGLSVEFDRQIVNAVINHLLYGQKQTKPANLSVNIFVPSLMNPSFTAWLTAKLSNYPEIANRLIFEVSENLLKKHLNDVTPIIKQLSDLGARWCIEHFGSIGEDQQYIDSAKIDFVKIDRRIINNISESLSQQLLFSSIVVSLKPRGIKLIAEGVEQPQDATYIEQTEIAAAQGYFYNQPRELSFDPTIKLASN